jgi:hypothetical protein
VVVVVSVGSGASGASGSLQASPPLRTKTGREKTSFTKILEYGHTHRCVVIRGLEGGKELGDDDIEEPVSSADAGSD